MRRFRVLPGVVIGLWLCFSVCFGVPAKVTPSDRPVPPPEPQEVSGSDRTLGQAPGSTSTLSPPTQVEGPEVLEPDYAAVVEDARKIVTEIENRLIVNHMEEAKTELSRSNAVAGHPKADEAYRDMEEMISFCEATAGKAGKACRFKLKMSMSLNPGDTLSQLSKGMGSGSIGAFGQGSGGQSGGSTPFGLFGPESFGKPESSSSRLGDKKTESHHAPMEGKRDPLAGNVEVLEAEKSEDLDLTSEGEAPIMEEYRPLIEEYFKRLSREE